jgi:hypothetical protein
MRYAELQIDIEAYSAADQKAFDAYAEKLITEAATWIGTPFQHQGQLKGIGVDCAHFIDICTSRAGYPGTEMPHDYHIIEDGSLMLQMLDQSRLELVPYSQRTRGHIIAFCDEAVRYPDKPRHLAFISEVTRATTFIMEVGRRGAVRHRLDGWWQKRIHSIWRPRVEVLREWITNQ